MDDSTRDEEAIYKAVGKSRFMLAVATTVLIMEHSRLPVTGQRFLDTVQRIIDGHFVPVNDVLTVTHSDATAQELMGYLRQSVELAAPLVEKYADEVWRET